MSDLALASYVEDEPDRIVATLFEWLGIFSICELWLEPGATA